MAKFKREHTWNVTIDGVQHEVYCRFEGNRYVLYADDDHVANVYRKSVHTMWQGMEEPVVMFGKPCIFIVWDEKPDIVVDGRIIGRKISYEKALKRKNNQNVIAYGVVFFSGILLLLVLTILLIFRGFNINEWFDALISWSTGIWMTIWGGKNMFRLTGRPKMPIISEDNNKGANSK